MRAPRLLRRRQLLLLLAAAPLAGPALARSLSRREDASAAAAERLHILALADCGSGDSAQRAVASQMADRHRLRPVDLVIMAGDNIYNDGDIRLVSSHFEKPYRALLQAGVPFHAVLGNHDIRADGGKGQLSYRPLGMAGRWYSLRRGPVQFLMIDTNPGSHWPAQLAWLNRELGRSNASWKVVVGHHPLYSEGFYGDDRALINRLKPLFQQHHVQLYINGHDHNYARTGPIDGTLYLTVGGGGASLRPIQRRRADAVAVSVHSFAELEFTPRSLHLQAWDRRGQRIDDLRLTGQRS